MLKNMKLILQNFDLLKARFNIGYQDKSYYFSAIKVFR